MASWVRKADPFPYEVAEMIVGGVLPVILLVFGTLTNFLAIVVLLKREHRQSSTNIYFIFLCLMDTLSLYQWNLHYAVYEFTNGSNQVTNQSLFLCKFGLFFAVYTFHTSAMFLTLIAIDRVFLLWNVQWYKNQLAQPKIALIISIIVFLCLFGIDGFILAFGEEINTFDNQTETFVKKINCFTSVDVRLIQFFSKEYQWLHLVFMNFIPFTVMFICTLFTVKKLLVRRSNQENEQMTQNAKRNRRISIMLLIMWAVYVCFTLPNRLSFSAFIDVLVNHPYSDVVFLSSNTLMYARNALNGLFLYVSVLAFRRDVHKIVSKCFCQENIRIFPLTVTGPVRGHSSLPTQKSNYR